MRQLEIGARTNWGVLLATGSDVGVRWVDAKKVGTPRRQVYYSSSPNASSVSKGFNEFALAT